MSVSKKIVIKPGEDIVVILSKDGKTADVIILGPRRGTRINAPIWSDEKWDQFINRRINASLAGHPMGMALQENEK